MIMEFQEVKKHLKQRFPMLMVDRVLELEPGKTITALKNVTGSEIQFMGHFPDFAVMPGTLIVEAFGQSASLLFSHDTGLGLQPGEFMVLGVINEMRFLVPVLPGQTMIMQVNIVKMVPNAALVEGTVRVNDVVVAQGRLSFARRTL
ncbi:MAG TPA: 3-hydroxyacyl-ACP dehydratase FabZ [Verrucomicrobiae bacterium]|jgi:3-hydroxyacyl-[acyl-carrier-protein] dehydratase|nr:3-hydroxyacyl-ACP dehydratase FabZ [Verrucomicrobiae bacterium]